LKRFPAHRIVGLYREKEFPLQRSIYEKFMRGLVLTGRLDECIILEAAGDRIVFFTAEVGSNQTKVIINCSKRWAIRRQKYPEMTPEERFRAIEEMRQ
jgi:hypothetical protein